MMTGSLRKKRFQQALPVQHQLHHYNLQHAMSFEMHFVIILMPKLNT